MEKYWLKSPDHFFFFFCVSRSCSSATSTNPVGSLLAESKSSGLKKVLQGVGSLWLLHSLPVLSSPPDMGAKREGFHSPGYNGKRQIMQ